MVTANGQHGSASIPQLGRQIISDIARCFLRLAKIDNRAFDCIGRYETMLLRRATAIETSLFEIEADHLGEFVQAREVQPHSSRDISQSPVRMSRKTTLCVLPT